MELTKKYHIKKNTVQETLIIPLYARKICSERFSKLFKDEEAVHICEMLDYDFAAKAKKMNSTMGLFGALEVAYAPWWAGFMTTYGLATAVVLFAAYLLSAHGLITVEYMMGMILFLFDAFGAIKTY